MYICVHYMACVCMSVYDMVYVCVRYGVCVCISVYVIGYVCVCLFML